jgi:hypothetical protein
MKLFGRGKRKEIKALPGRDKLAGRIVSMILKIQNGFAGLMSRATKNLSIAAMKWTLLLFTLTGSGLSIYFISLAISKKKNAVIKPDRLQVPQYYDRSGDPIIMPDLLILPEEHEEMRQFQHYMDSLRSSKTGKLLYDSIILNRPGLMDSIRVLEEIYQSQNKK